MAPSLSLAYSEAIRDPKRTNRKLLNTRDESRGERCGVGIAGETPTECRSLRHLQDSENPYYMIGLRPIRKQISQALTEAFVDRFQASSCA
jgi:hypothetical protein